MRKFLKTRIQAYRTKTEEGVALLSVVMVSLVIFILLATIAGTVLSSTLTLANDRGTTAAVSKVDSGLDAALASAVMNRCVRHRESTEVGYSYNIYRSASDEKPTSVTAPGVMPGCPQTGDKYLVVEASTDDGAHLTVVNSYLWVTRDLSGRDGAVVSGGGTSFSTSALAVLGADGDLFLAEGNLNCNNSSTFDGDVFVLQGNVTLSNACFIGGSLYASGSVAISNNAVGVAGDVYSLGNFSMSTGATIGRDVRTRGTLTVNSGAKINGSATGTRTTLGNTIIGGSVSASGPLSLNVDTRIHGSVLTSDGGAVQVYGSTIGGDLFVNGYFSQLQVSSVGGNVTAAATGRSNSVAPNVTIGGNLTLAGTVSTWGAGPSVTGTSRYNRSVTSILPPSFELPEQFDEGFFAWRDYDYKESDWVSAGYELKTLTSCDFQNNALLVAEVNSRTSPTLYDLRGCSPRFFAVTFALRTNVAFISNGFTDSNRLTVNSADGEEHQINFLTPDAVKDGAPTCGVGQGTSNLYEFTMGDGISGSLYTPCVLTFGGKSTINGQLYAGAASYSGSQKTSLNYRPIFTPGFPVELAAPVKAAYNAEDTHRAVPLLVHREES
ncbi:hypothetical protein [Microbacterium sp. KR10-403]|uniref:hypothetical protein n=1 Tax=Microbacterium sp. KR10-403 TaxID=3158581 RepID=UPI0032E516FF